IVIDKRQHTTDLLYCFCPAVFLEHCQKKIFIFLKSLSHNSGSPFLRPLIPCSGLRYSCFCSSAFLLACRSLSAPTTDCFTLLDLDPECSIFSSTLTEPNCSSRRDRIFSISAIAFCTSGLSL